MGDPGRSRQPAIASSDMIYQPIYGQLENVHANSMHQTVYSNTHTPGPSLRAHHPIVRTPDTSPSSTRLTPPSDASDDHEMAGRSSDVDVSQEKAFPMTDLQARPDKLSRSARRSSEDQPSGSDSSRSSEEQKEAEKDRPLTGEHQVLYTAQEAKLVRKRFDWRLVPFLTFLYLLSFLDRSNIGNARIAGLESDLRLTSSQYEWLLTAFYITYILFEWMALLYRLVPAHIYIAICVASWGIIASLQSIVTSFPSLLILRALLGIGEAAFGPGVPFYLSFFYRREELAFRTGLFISAAPLATSFASGLAWIIIRLGQNGPIAPWRLLFLVEGFPSVLVAVTAWTFIPDSPETASFLTKRQKRVAKLRLATADDSRRDRTASESKGLQWKEVLRTLADPKCYLTASIFFSCNVAFSSLPVFLPTIIKEMNHSPLTTQLLLLPPYLLSFVLLLFTSYLSDHLATRSIPLIIHALLASTGYLALSLASPSHLNLAPTARYLALFPTTIGFFSAITLIITWTLNNQNSATGRGVGITILNVVGQCGPLLGTRLYPEKEGPFYGRGMAVCAGFMALVAVLAAGLRWWLLRENRRAALVGRKGGFRYMV